MKTKLIFAIFFTFSMFISFSQKKNPDTLVNTSLISDIKFRNIGPAFMSGRIADIAIDPENQNIWYAAVGSGGVWKTENGGTTWKSIFDGQNVYSTGCIAVDPANRHTIWVGTGENVGGRHVGFGDGIYKSTDDGMTWSNMGLKKSEHISKIIINSRNSDEIYVAAQGPLWSSGGDRGFFKSSDGGKTWKKTLGDDLWTGVTDIAADPRNSNIIYAATWQRHRNIAAYMGGGTESAIYRSDDGGETWKKLTKGLPDGKLGKIGLAVSPQNPDVVYAAIEQIRRKGGVYRSDNRGESWTKMSETVAGGTGPHYYQELYASPHKFDKIYLVDVMLQISEDGGKTFRRIDEKSKHVDNHAIAFRKNEPEYLLVGTDGGLYETFDNTQNWRHISNLPVTQFYKVAVDDDFPFYNIYGGTQDNNTQGGPSRTRNINGITSREWKVILFADGHQPATEPGNPDLLYAQFQQGNLMRYDRTTGEKVFIQPQPGEGEPVERFNWDSPIIVSPHSPTRLYFASHRVWRSDNRGDEWRSISGDLTNPVERLDLPVMGNKQSWDSPWDFDAMSEFNTITSLSESPVKEGLIYAGTDDGSLSVTENGGVSWTRIPLSKLPGAPPSAFVNDIKADLFDENSVYICLDNHKAGDFKPYVYKSNNKGDTWKSIVSNLPAVLMTWRIVQDHVNPGLMFLATEFGIYCTFESGNKWHKMNTDATISFRDLAIQRRENDLVGASFGRGFFILDDYTPLRYLNEEMLKKEAVVFPVRKTWWYIERNPLGGNDKAALGETFYTAPNPPFGATFTYYLRDGIQTLAGERKKRENELSKNNKEIGFPGWESLDREKTKEIPSVFFSIIDASGNIVDRVTAPSSKGIHRVSWDLKMMSTAPIGMSERENNYSEGRSFMAPPGIYRVFLNKYQDGILTVISDTVEFKVEQLLQGKLSGSDPQQVAGFWKETLDFQAQISEFNMVLRKTKSMTESMKKALEVSQCKDAGIYKKIADFRSSVINLESAINGSPSKNEVGESDIPRIRDRMNAVMSGISNSTYGPTTTHRKTLEIAKKEFSSYKNRLEILTEKDLPELLKALKDAGAPYIQGQKMPE
ncbi:MAG: VPS10 domain-containing protein [Deltaproteobacteria bacterium]